MLRNTAIAPLLCIALIATITGCGRAPAPQFQSNGVEWLKQEKVNLGVDDQGEPERFAKATREEVDRIMLSLFGTPNGARFPFVDVSTEQHSIVNLENLKLAAGAVASDDDGKPQGLYREHCALCHGIHGDGAGPNAAILEPYPRDFRMGRFKFKSTPQRHPPTNDDLRKILKQGIPGTGMPEFSRLDDAEIDALIDYVKYLSMRGQFERYLMNEVASLRNDSFFENENQRRDLLPSDEQPEEAEVAEQANAPTASVGSQPLKEFLFDYYAEQFGDQYKQFVIDRWQSVNNAETIKLNAPPEAPAWIDSEHPKYPSKVEAGRALFLGKGTCFQCHGRDGKGLGELVGYDAWTEDWIKSPGVDANDKKTYRDFLKAGAHRPVLARPRNLSQAIYRGGGEPATIFLRIANGIEGSPMPAASALKPHEIWALTAFVLAVPKSPELLADVAQGDTDE